MSEAYFVSRRPREPALSDGVVSLGDFDDGGAAERFELDVGHFDAVLDAEVVEQEQQVPEACVGFVPVDVAVVGVLAHVQLGDGGHVFVVPDVEDFVEHVDLRESLELRVEEDRLQPRKAALFLQLDALSLDAVRAVPKVLLTLLQPGPALQEQTHLLLQVVLLELQLRLQLLQLRLFLLELGQPLLGEAGLLFAELCVELVVGPDEA